MPNKRPTRKKTKPANKSRRIASWLSLITLVLYIAFSCVGSWYVRHPLSWIEQQNAKLPKLLTMPLMYFGDRAAFITDAMGWTGHDAVYEFDEEAPAGQILFAGMPKRIDYPAPKDIKVLNRGDFLVGWSPSQRYPVWVAYHVPAEAKHPLTPRPKFQQDRSVASSPKANIYSRSGYDRGHMAPNYAITTRFGKDAQKKTFLMTNIAPQRPALNRGPWREIEHRITDLWTKKYGEIWVIVGTVNNSRDSTFTTSSGTAIDAPEYYYTLMLAQTKEGIRALAILMPQTVSFDTFPVHYIVTIKELEKITGLDFLAELPSFIQSPLETDRPTRLWPIRWFDVIKLILLRFV